MSRWVWTGGVAFPGLHSAVVAELGLEFLALGRPTRYAGDTVCGHVAGRAFGGWARMAIENFLQRVDYIWVWDRARFGWVGDLSSRKLLEASGTPEGEGTEGWQGLAHWVPRRAFPKTPSRPVILGKPHSCLPEPP